MEEYRKTEIILEEVPMLRFPSMEIDMPHHRLVKEEIYPTLNNMPTGILTRPSTSPTKREVGRMSMLPTLDYHMITWHRSLVETKIVTNTTTRTQAR